MTNPVASQQPAPIPEDLTGMYERLQKFRLGGPAFILGSTDSITLIERIARLEAALRAFPSYPETCQHGEEPDYCDGCLVAYQKAVADWERVRDAALSTPPGTHGSTKEGTNVE